MKLSSKNTVLSISSSRSVSARPDVAAFAGANTRASATTTSYNERGGTVGVPTHEVSFERTLRGAATAVVASAACLNVFFGVPGLVDSTSTTALAVSGGRNGNNSTPISNTDFSGQNLTESDFTKTIMKQCNFDKSNLRGVSLFASYAEGSTFRGADLSFADLESGNFEDVDFTDAVLEGAQVSAARFERAIIDNTDWTDVVLRKDVQRDLCRIAKGTNPTTGEATRDTLMC